MKETVMALSKFQKFSSMASIMESRVQERNGTKKGWKKVKLVTQSQDHKADPKSVEVVE